MLLIRTRVIGHKSLLSGRDKKQRFLWEVSIDLSYSLLWSIMSQPLTGPDLQDILYLLNISSVRSPYSNLVDAGFYSTVF